LPRLKKFLSFAKKLIAGIVILSIISFIAYMGTIAYIRSLKTLKDLSYVSGEVTDVGMVKHMERHKYERPTIEDVLVFSIEGSNEKFGFLQHSDAFKQLLGFNTAGKQFEIYFDPEGGRIEEGVTLNIYDLTVGQAKIIDIKETNEADKLTSIFFFALSLLLIIIVSTGIRQSIKKAHKQRLY
jgi:hypothetical protein